MKTCAVMQPYLFPYIGYYQLVYSADSFIIYDDVTFIKQSYINRNSILINGEARRFNLPVLGASSNKFIKDLSYGSADKILKTIKQSYSKAPYYKNVIEIIESVFTNEERHIAKINHLSISKVFEYLGIEKNINFSSALDYDRTAERADRLIELTKIHGCGRYVNAPGGQSLYEKKHFLNRGVQLNFIETKINKYRQLSDVFIPYLSMIDIIMFCDRYEIVEMLKNYELN